MRITSFLEGLSPKVVAYRIAECHQEAVIERAERFILCLRYLDLTGLAQDVLAQDKFSWHWRAFAATSL
jgi:hypothetical protein